MNNSDYIIAQEAFNEAIEESFQSPDMNTLAKEDPIYKKISNLNNKQPDIFDKTLAGAPVLGQDEQTEVKVVDVIDADTIIVNDGNKDYSIRINSPLRYDANEVRHSSGNNSRVGFFSNTDKSEYAKNKQVYNTAKILGKDPRDVTEDEVYKVGEWQKRNLINWLSTGSYDKTYAEFNDDNTQDSYNSKLNLDGLTVKVNLKDLYNNSDSHNRSLTTVYNPTTGVDVGWVASKDSYMNAFNQNNPIDSETDKDGTLGEMVDVVQSGATQWYFNAASAFNNGLKAGFKAAGVDEDTIDNLLPKDMGDLTNPRAMDDYFGVKKETRIEQAAAINRMDKAVESGDYTTAIANAVKVAPIMIADSIPEMAALVNPVTFTATVAGRVDKQAREYAKNNDGRLPNTEKLLQMVATNIAVLLGEKLFLKGLGKAVKGTGTVSKTLKGAASKRPVQVVGSTAFEAGQEWADQTQEMYNTQREGERTLSEIATSTDAKVAALLGGTMGGVMSGTAHTIGAIKNKIPKNLKDEIGNKLNKNKFSIIDDNEWYTRDYKRNDLTGRLIARRVLEEEQNDETLTSDPRYKKFKEINPILIKETKEAKLDDVLSEAIATELDKALLDNNVEKINLLQSELQALKTNKDNLDKIASIELETSLANDFHTLVNDAEMDPLDKAVQLVKLSNETDNTDLKYRLKKTITNLGVDYKDIVNKLKEDDIVVLGSSKKATDHATYTKNAIVLTGNALVNNKGVLNVDDRSALESVYKENGLTGNFEDDIVETINSKVYKETTTGNNGYISNYNKLKKLKSAYDLLVDEKEKEVISKQIYKLNKKLEGLYNTLVRKYKAVNDAVVKLDSASKPTSSTAIAEYKTATTGRVYKWKVFKNNGKIDSKTLSMLDEVGNHINNIKYILGKTTRYTKTAQHDSTNITNNTNSRVDISSNNNTSNLNSDAVNKDDKSNTEITTYEIESINLTKIKNNPHKVFLIGVYANSPTSVMKTLMDRVEKAKLTNAIFVPVGYRATGKSKKVDFTKDKINIIEELKKVNRKLFQAVKDIKADRIDIVYTKNIKDKLSSSKIKEAENFIDNLANISVLETTAETSSKAENSNKPLDIDTVNEDTETIPKATKVHKKGDEFLDLNINTDGTNTKIKKSLNLDTNIEETETTNTDTKTAEESNDRPSSLDSTNTSNNKPLKTHKGLSIAYIANNSATAVEEKYSNSMEDTIESSVSEDDYFKTEFLDTEATFANFSQSKNITHQMSVSLSKVVKPVFANAERFLNFLKKSVYSKNVRLRAAKRTVTALQLFRSHLINDNNVYVHKDSPARQLLFIDNNGKKVINKGVITALSLALDTYLSFNSRLITNLKTNKEIEDMLNTNTKLSADAYTFFRDKGTFASNAAFDIGTEVVRLLGIKPQSGVSEEVYNRLIANIGSTALLIAEREGSIKINDVSLQEYNEHLPEGVSDIDIKDINDKATIPMIVQNEYTPSPVFKDTITELEEFYEEPINLRKFTLEKPLTPKDEVKNVPYTKVPDEAYTTLMKLNNTKYVVLKPVIEFIKNNKEITKKYLGFTSSAKLADMAKDAADSAEAVNDTVEASIEHLVTEEKPTMYFDWFFSRNGRFFNRSVTINPASDKLHRFAVVPEDAVDVEFNTKNDKSMKNFKLGIAQAFGFSIDKKSLKDSYTFAEKIMKIKAEDLLTSLEDGTLEENFKEIGIEVEHLSHTLQGIEAIRKYQARKGNTFKATLLAETDALTSGFAHKLLQFPVIDNVYKWLEKTGIVKFNPDIFEDFSMANVISDSSFYDSYESIMQNLTLGSIDKNAKAVIDLLPKIENNDKDERIVPKKLRTLIKYPFMIFNYGGSATSIQKAIASGETYTIIEEAVESYNKNTLTKEQKVLISHLLNLKPYTILDGKNIAITTVDNLISMFKEYNLDRIYYDRGRYRNSLFKYISDTINTNYANKVTDALLKEFEAFTKVNTNTIGMMDIIFEAFDLKYNKKVKERLDKINKERKDNIADLSIVEKNKIIKELYYDIFPAIKTPYNTDLKQSAIPLYKKNNKSNKDLILDSIQTHYIDLNSEKKTKTVKHLIKSLEAGGVSSVVVPIHWIDGAIIAKAVNAARNGLIPVHDAIVASVAHIGEISKIYNKATIDVNKNYSIIGSVAEKVDYIFFSLTAEEKKIIYTKLQNKYKSRNITIKSIINGFYKDVANVTANRKKLFNQRFLVEHMVGTADSKVNVDTKNAELHAIDEIHSLPEYEKLSITQVKKLRSFINKTSKRTGVKVLFGENYEYRFKYDKEAKEWIITAPSNDTVYNKIVYIAHEMVHSLTYGYIQKNIDSKIVTILDNKDIIEELENILNSIVPPTESVSNVLQRLAYAKSRETKAERVAEVVAILYAEPEVRDFIINKVSGKTTLWRKALYLMHKIISNIIKEYNIPTKYIDLMVNDIIDKADVMYSIPNPDFGSKLGAIRHYPGTNIILAEDIFEMWENEQEQKQVSQTNNSIPVNKTYRSSDGKYVTILSYNNVTDTVKLNISGVNKTYEGYIVLDGRSTDTSAYITIIDTNLNKKGNRILFEGYIPLNDYNLISNKKTVSLYSDKKAKEIDLDSLGTTKVSRTIVNNSEELINLLVKELDLMSTNNRYAHHIKTLFKSINEHLIKPIDIEKVIVNGNENHGITDLNSIKLILGKDYKYKYNLNMSPSEVLSHEVIHILFNNVINNVNSATKKEILKDIRDIKAGVLTKDFSYKNLLPSKPTKKDIERAKDLFSYITDSKHSDLEFIAIAFTNPIMVEYLKNLPIKDEKSKTWLDKLTAFFIKTINFLTNKKVFNSSENYYDLLYTSVFEATDRAYNLFSILNNTAKVTSKIVTTPIRTSFKIADESLKKVINLLKDMLLKENIKIEKFNSKTASRLDNLLFLLRYLPKLLLNPKYRNTRDIVLKSFGISNNSTIHSYISVLDDKEDTYKDVVDYIDNAVILDTTRRNLIHNIKGIIVETFSKELTDKEYDLLRDVFIDTDISALKGKYNIKKLLLNDNNILTQINKLERQIRKTTPTDYRFIINQARGLGKFLITHEANTQQLKNAYNIAQGKSLLNIKKKDIDETLVRQIDELATLNALLYLDKDTKQSALGFYTKEKAGVDTLLDYHIRSKEDTKKYSDITEFQKVKGYYTETQNSNLEFKIAPVNEETVSSLKKEGYKLYSKNKTDDNGLYIRSKLYNDKYVKSAIRLHSEKVQGTTLEEFMYEKYKGKRSDRFIADKILKEKKRLINEMHKAFNKANSFVHKNKTYFIKAKEDWVPVYDTKGKLITFTKIMNKQLKKELFNNNIITDLAYTIASINDEHVSKEHNLAVLDMLIKDADANYIENNSIGLNGKMYVLLEKDSDNSYIRNIYKNLPTEIKSFIEYNGPLPVRSDMLFKYFGYKDPSIVDYFSVFKITPNKFNHIIRTVEQIWKDLISLAKTNIIIKIPYVFIKNIISNLVQFFAKGQNPVKATLEHLKVTRDFVAYLKIKHKIEALEALPSQSSEVKDKIKALNNQLEKYGNVHTLVKAGVYQAIVEEVNLNDNIHGNIVVDFIKDKYNKLPNSLKYVGDVIYLTSETEYFKAATKAIQYSDFISRVVDYNHRVGGKVVYDKKAISGIKEEFVNYNVPLPPLEQYLNEVGLFMFTKYAKRVQRVIKNNFAEHPLYALTYGILGIMFDIPNIFSDSPLPSNIYNYNPDIGDTLMKAVMPALL